ncbi:hypothetical protein A2851_02000 [Candidatus Kaiserbacteria bacterium RIFCSPHIGHO2_01_FULL_53_29]|uniref:Uncharacterized protein n=1 Tax=Candidatus Kaiserbacteria bacterium RIFCSPHIGHO2_01_FULL_53_29 TaxID=1798480 RepID=A0A1F6CX46_9BACT|nr:MAG: hypothetical protein A2851_02000 [Candidatus Kaiserbacteria bacterium RIFCSPHIGHO2_01_FULL_53_29]
MGKISTEDECAGKSGTKREGLNEPLPSPLPTPRDGVLPPGRRGNITGKLLNDAAEKLEKSPEGYAHSTRKRRRK